MNTDNKLNKLLLTKADIKQALIDKGLNPSDVFSTYADDIRSITSGGSSGDMLGEIGWNLAEQPFLKDAIDYAKEILKNPKSTYLNDTLLIIFPKVEELELKTNMFYNSCLAFFPDGIKITGSLNSAFYETYVTNVDLSDFTSTSDSFYQAFYNCRALQYINTNEGFGENIKNMKLAFYNCIKLQYIDYINTSSATDLYQSFYACKNLKRLPDIDISNCTTMYYTFYNCTELESLTIIGDVSALTNTGYTFYGCSSLTYLSIPENFPITGSTYGIITDIKAPKIYGSFDYSQNTISSNSNYNWITYSYINKHTRYLIVKNLGTYVNTKYINTTNSLVWGIANDEVPDARQSLIDSLITYSFDRASAGYVTCSITLYKDVKALLTEDEIAQITAKGYTIA